ncbi:MAG TPA: PadR family transcriptional regulator [Bryobacteraceae bacterium]|nr:PadR family transcriptional regulator [Bryobacteraceae bacterium]
MGRFGGNTKRLLARTPVSCKPRGDHRGDVFGGAKVCGAFSILRRLNIKLDYGKTRFPAGIARLARSKILSRRPRLHGYAIMSAIKESSGDVLRADEGSLYPALHRMEEDGWIRAEWITKDTGRRARVYELTAAGKKQLADEESRWRVVTSAVNRVLRTVLSP